MKSHKIKNIFEIFFRQLKSPLIYILIIASIITFALEEYGDFLVLSFSILINTILGFYQEYKAHDTVEKLKNYVKSKNLVETNKGIEEVDSDQIQVEDIIILTQDYKIPADGEIIEGSLVVNEHILTGESLPIEKTVGDTVYQGTSIVSGYAKYVAKHTGNSTKFGEISDYVTNTKEPMTPLQLQMTKLANTISIIVLFNAIGIFALGLYRNIEIYEMLTVSVAVAVASVPEGLVIALTVVLAVGMRNVLKRKAVVKKLVSAETLGSVTTICVDKTGTITYGKLEVVLSELDNEEDVFKIIKNANNKLDSLDRTLSEWAEQNSESFQSRNSLQKIDYLPFDSSNKFTSTVVKLPSGEMEMLIYGAAEILLSNSNLNTDSKNKWHEMIDSQSHAGAKVIGYAIKPISEQGNVNIADISDCRFVGMHALSDTIRENIPDTIEQIRNAGVNLKLITGDHMGTALSIARQAGIVDVGINEQSNLVMTGKQIEALSDEDLRDVVNEIVIFARVSPKDKFRVVKALSEIGEVVAMTGDGVNDAPALKKSAIGIVVNEASDVSKEVADIVLLDSNLSTIVHSIEEGRRIFANIRKVTLYLFSGSLTELILIMSSLLFNLPLAITAGQILWINLIEDSLPALSLSMEPAEKDLMKVRPDRNTFTLLDKDLLRIMITFIIITDVSLVIIYYHLLSIGLEVELVRTIIFATLGFGSLIYIFSCKSTTKSIFTYNIFSNKYLVYSTVFEIFMLVLAIYLPVFNLLLGTVPLEAKYWIIAVSFAFFNILVIETVKITANKFRR